MEEKEIVIGKQIWMSRNLDVVKFRNGDDIPHAKTDEEWRDAGEKKQPAWCYYENKTANGEKYGKLYNWFAVNDPRGLAPEGWHIPSDAEWQKLVKFLGGKKVAGTKLKSTEGWAATMWSDDENGNGSNETGFSGLPGGNRGFNSIFSGIDISGDWWSSTEDSEYTSWGLQLNSTDSCNKSNVEKENGASVRCLKD